MVTIFLLAVYSIKTYAFSKKHRSAGRFTINLSKYIYKKLYAFL